MPAASGGRFLSLGQMDKKQFKVIPLSKLNAIESSPGGFEGYASVFGDLDDGGDIVLRGAFTQTIPEFVKSGFIAPDHDWSVDKELGYVLAAEEDDHGLKIKVEFHDTADAQQIRQKMLNRIRKGKSASLSIGYLPEGKQYVSKTDAIKYLKDNSPESLAKLNEFDSIRLLSKVRLFETSFVTVPMLASAQVTQAKSGNESKGAFEDAVAERVMCPWEIAEFTWQAAVKIDQMEDAADTMGQQFDVTGPANIAADEARARTIAWILDFLNEDESDEGMAFMGRPDSKSLLSEKLVTGLSPEEHAEVVVSTLRKFQERMSKNNGARVKEGRMLSEANRTRLQKVRDAMDGMMSVMTEIDDLLTQSAPKPKHAQPDLNTTFEFLQMEAQLAGIL
jgi:HK97 family phage prohead protease